jgi:two-component system response regulator FixJ
MMTPPSLDGLVVHVIDDDDAVRESLVFLLKAAKIPVQAYASAAAFLETLPNVAAGCVLTDVRMPNMDGLELQQRLIDLNVKLPVIVMTGHADLPVAIKALKAGAADFIEKPFDRDVLLTAIRAALESGERRQHAEAAVAEIEARMNSLTPRERQVLDALVGGASNKAIGRDLGMSPRTVEVHRARIMLKMQARSLSELIRLVVAINL